MISTDYDSRKIQAVQLNSFINDFQQGLFMQEHEIYYARCLFDIKDYYKGLFHLHNIYLPENIKQSVSKRQGEYFAGRYCAKTALNCLGVKNLSVSTGDKRQPLWPYGVSGAISHTNSSALCIVSKADEIRGLGIDQEYVVTRTLMNEISSQIVSEEELAVLSNGQLKSTVAFTATFSAKESFFKAMFPIYKDYFGFDAISLVALNFHQGKGKLTFELNKNFNDKYQIGKQVSGYFYLSDDHQENKCKQRVEGFFVLT